MLGVTILDLIYNIIYNIPFYAMQHIETDQYKEYLLEVIEGQRQVSY